MMVEMPSGGDDTVVLDHGRVMPVRSSTGGRTRPIVITGSGAVVAGDRAPDGVIRHAYLWQHGRSVELTRPDNTAPVTVGGVSSNGNVVASLGAGDNVTSVLWSQGRTTRLLTAAGRPFRPAAVNDQRQVVGLVGNSGVVLWAAGRITDSFTVDYRALVAMNNHGVVVVTSFVSLPGDFPDRGGVYVYSGGRRIVLRDNEDPARHVWITDAGSVVYDTSFADDPHNAMVHVDTIQCTP
jgi:hypothetical protein